MIFLWKNARGWILVLALCTVISACAPTPGQDQTPLSFDPVVGTVTPTLSSCLPCGSAAATMTARIPATQTAAVQQMTQTAVAPMVKATLTAVAQLSATPTAISTATQACGESLCYLDGHFLMQRPTSLDAHPVVERSYPYGSSQNDTREIHHGVEFYQPFGTPVLAAADGEVVFAGDDKLTLIGWVTGFYGNVIVLEHSLNDQTVYSLYGHLSVVKVQAGQTVTAGEVIGEVGASGTARGSHLHFEVRQGKNDYKSTRNPELWLAPLPETGVLAGSILDAAGNLLKGAVNVQRVENGVLNAASVGAASTYPRESLNADDLWQESFVIGELPAGDYRLSLVHNGVVYEQMVKIEAGKLTLVKFVVK